LKDKQQHPIWHRAAVLSPLFRGWKITLKITSNGDLLVYLALVIFLRVKFYLAELFGLRPDLKDISKPICEKLTAGKINYYLGEALNEN